jgi:signal transduction histidine kinase
MDNALRHGGTGVSIDVHAGARGDRAWLTVSDDGPGIPEDQRERIFERFHRGAARDTGGSGLGLPIAHQLARSMGGSLRVASTTESGTTFEVELPR